jgi:cytoskeletal protein CcmA (bactofilin family)
VSYFTQRKSERDVPPETTAAKPPELLSTFGPGMMVTGNVVCTGTLQVLGRVTGDIHAGHLMVGAGARVEGNVIAQEAVIQGSFNGTVRANTVKLQSTAVVEGEIYNSSLTIEPNAQFEGVARRLDRPVEAPTAEQVKGPAAPVLTLAPAAEAFG